MAARVEKTRAGIDSAISTVLSNLPQVDSLKDEQRTVLEEFIRGKDVINLVFTQMSVFPLSPLSDWILVTSRVSFNVSG